MCRNGTAGIGEKNSFADCQGCVIISDADIFGVPVRLTINYMKGNCPSTPPVATAADVRIAIVAGFVRLHAPGSSG